jgi:hypothetical protein
MELKVVMEELDSIFGKEWSMFNIGLVMEYYKAKQIGKLSDSIIDAASSIGAVIEKLPDVDEDNNPVSRLFNIGQ